MTTLKESFRLKTYNFCKWGIFCSVLGKTSKKLKLAISSVYKEFVFTAAQNTKYRQQPVNMARIINLNIYNKIKCNIFFQIYIKVNLKKHYCNPLSS